MRFSEGNLGRIFILRLEEGDRIPDVIERFADEKDIDSAMVLFLGGVADGSRVVVGPEEGYQKKIVPMIHALEGPQEILGIGTLFRNEGGAPVLHMHAASGREGGATVGCTRAGVDIWLVGEAVLIEIVNIEAIRARDPKSGFDLLSLDQGTG